MTPREKIALICPVCSGKIGASRLHEEAFHASLAALGAHSLARFFVHEASNRIKECIATLHWLRADKFRNDEKTGRIERLLNELYDDVHAFHDTALPRMLARRSMAKEEFQRLNIDRISFLRLPCKLELAPDIPQVFPIIPALYGIFLCGVYSGAARSIGRAHDGSMILRYESRGTDEVMARLTVHGNTEPLNPLDDFWTLPRIQAAGMLMPLKIYGDEQLNYIEWTIDMAAP